MQSHKIFRHIRIIPDFHKKQTFILFVANHYIEPNILKDLKSYRVEVIGGGIKAFSLPDENIITYPFRSEDLQVYIQGRFEK